MWMKNLQPYRLSTEWPITADKLADQLSRRLFNPCGALDTERRGWVPPAEGDDALVHSVAGQWLICMQTETKILPAAVVRQEAEKYAAKVAEQQGYKPGRKQMKDIREMIIAKLLPKAFVRQKRTYAWIDPANGWLVVDAPSQSRAEGVLEVLRQSLDTLPIAMLSTERSPASAMADWLAAGEAPSGFTIDQDAELRSVADDSAKVKYVHHSLDGEDVRSHLAAGKLPTKLAMTFDGRISFVLTDKPEIKRLEFLDVVKERVADAEDAQALFDAEFALMTGELQRLLAAVVEALGGEMQREPDLVDKAREAA